MQQLQRLDKHNVHTVLSASTFADLAGQGVCVCLCYLVHTVLDQCTRDLCGMCCCSSHVPAAFAGPAWSQVPTVLSCTRLS